MRKTIALLMMLLMVGVVFGGSLNNLGPDSIINDENSLQAKDTVIITGTSTGGTNDAIMISDSAIPPVGTGPSASLQQDPSNPEILALIDKAKNEALVKDDLKDLNKDNALSLLGVIPDLAEYDEEFVKAYLVKMQDKIFDVQDKLSGYLQHAKLLSETGTIDISEAEGIMILPEEVEQGEESNYHYLSAKDRLSYRALIPLLSKMKAKKTQAGYSFEFEMEGKSFGKIAATGADVHVKKKVVDAVDDNGKSIKQVIPVIEMGNAEFQFRNGGVFEGDSNTVITHSYDKGVYSFKDKDTGLEFKFNPNALPYNKLEVNVGNKAIDVASDDLPVRVTGKYITQDFEAYVPKGTTLGMEKQGSTGLKLSSFNGPAEVNYGNVKISGDIKEARWNMNSGQFEYADLTGNGDTVITTKSVQQDDHWVREPRTRFKNNLPDGQIARFCASAACATYASSQIDDGVIQGMGAEFFNKPTSAPSWRLKGLTEMSFDNPQTGKPVSMEVVKAGAEAEADYNFGGKYTYFNFRADEENLPKAYETIANVKTKYEVKEYGTTKEREYQFSVKSQLDPDQWTDTERQQIVFPKAVGEQMSKYINDNRGGIIHRGIEIIPPQIGVEWITEGGELWETEETAWFTDQEGFPELQKIVVDQDGTIKKQAQIAPKSVQVIKQQEEVQNFASDALYGHPAAPEVQVSQPTPAATPLTNGGPQPLTRIVPNTNPMTNADVDNEVFRQSPGGSALKVPPVIVGNGMPMMVSPPVDPIDILDKVKEKTLNPVIKQKIEQVQETLSQANTAVQTAIQSGDSISKAVAAQEASLTYEEASSLLNDVASDTLALFNSVDPREDAKTTISYLQDLSQQLGYTDDTQGHAQEVYSALGLNPVDVLKDYVTRDNGPSYSESQQAQLQQFFPDDDLYQETAQRVERIQEVVNELEARGTQGDDTALDNLNQQAQIVKSKAKRLQTKITTGQRVSQQEQDDLKSTYSTFYDSFQTATPYLQEGMSQFMEGFRSTTIGAVEDTEEKFEQFDKLNSMARETGFYNEDPDYAAKKIIETSKLELQAQGKKLSEYSQNVQTMVEEARNEPTGLNLPSGITSRGRVYVQQTSVGEYNVVDLVKENGQYRVVQPTDAESKNLEEKYEQNSLGMWVPKGSIPTNVVYGIEAQPFQLRRALPQAPTVAKPTTSYGPYADGYRYGPTTGVGPMAKEYQFADKQYVDKFAFDLNKQVQYGSAQKEAVARGPTPEKETTKPVPEPVEPAAISKNAVRETPKRLKVTTTQTLQAMRVLGEKVQPSLVEQAIKDGFNLPYSRGAGETDTQYATRVSDLYNAHLTKSSEFTKRRFGQLLLASKDTPLYMRKKYKDMPQANPETIQRLMDMLNQQAQKATTPSTPTVTKPRATTSPDPRVQRVLGIQQSLHDTKVVEETKASPIKYLQWRLQRIRYQRLNQGSLQ